MEKWRYFGGFRFKEKLIRMNNKQNHETDIEQEKNWYNHYF